VATLKDLKQGTAISRNRDMAWDRLLDRPSAERLITVDLVLQETPAGFELQLRDADGHMARADLASDHQAAKDAVRAEAALREQLAKLGGTEFEARKLTLALSQPWFVPTSALNALRREAVAALRAAREAAFQRLPRATPVSPPVPYPADMLSYLANVYNRRAADFYARHGVRVIGAAYESHEVLGEASLMITRHCVRWSLSLCPKQAKGVIGVQGTVRAEPLTLVHGKDRLTLRFDCKACEMHVVGQVQPHVLRDARRQAAAQPIQVYRTRPPGAAKARTKT
jgi:putative protease